MTVYNAVIESSTVNPLLLAVSIESLTTVTLPERFKYCKQPARTTVYNRRKRSLTGE